MLLVFLLTDLAYGASPASGAPTTVGLPTGVELSSPAPAGHPGTSARSACPSQGVGGGAPSASASCGGGSRFPPSPPPRHPQGAGVVITTIPTAGGPYGITYDSGKNRVYVGDNGASAVQVIDPTTQSVVATIPLGAGNDPTGLTYDSIHGYIYAANIGAGTVSIISDTTNTLLATVPVGYSPWGIAYDDRNGYVYVANDGAGTTVKIFNGLSIIGGVVVGSSPDGVTYDGENGYVYTANSGTRTVSIISGATNTVVGTLSYGGWYPYWVAYGAKSGDVYVADAGNARVWVISGYTNSLVTSIAMPSGQVEMAYDSGNNDAYASPCGGSSVMVIDGSTNTYLTSIGTGSSPCGVIYDPLNGDLYVANIGSNTVAVISTSNPTASVPSASPSSVDLSQGTTFSTIPSGGVPPYTYAWNGLPPGCATSSAPTLFCRASATGTSYVTVSITDSTGTVTTSGALPFTVFPDPTVTVPSPKPGSVDGNQTVSFTTTAAKGTGNYTTYTWATSGAGLGCVIANSPTLSCTPTLSGTYWVSVYVTDTNGCNSGTPASCAATVSTSAPFVVYPDPTVGAPSAVPSIVDAGQIVNFTSALPVGGLAPYAYSWSGLPASCGVTTGATVPCTPSTGGTFNISVAVTDANGYSITSPTLTYLVNSTLAISLTASANSLDLGQTVKFTVVPSFGSPPYTYYWAAPSALGCTASAGSSLNCTPSQSGSYPVSVAVTDRAGKHLSASRTVGVAVDPTVALTGTNATDVGRPMRLGTNVSGGTPPYTFSWGSIPQLGCAPTTGGNLSCTPLSPGVYADDVVVTDSVGGSDTLAFLVTANAAPSLTLIGPGATDVGSPTDYVATIAGGTAPFRYVWTTPPSFGCTGAPGPSIQCSPSHIGVYNLSVVMTDVTGLSSSRALSVNVSSSLSATIEGSVTATAGAAWDVRALVSGGVAPYFFTWTYPVGLGCASSLNNSLYCLPAASGRYTLRVTVTDLTGSNTTASLPLSVLPAPPAPPTPTVFSTFTFWWPIPLFVAVLLALLLIYRRRKAQDRRDSRSEPDEPEALPRPSSSGSTPAPATELKDVAPSVSAAPPSTGPPSSPSPSPEAAPDPGPTPSLTPASEVSEVTPMVETVSPGPPTGPVESEVAPGPPVAAVAPGPAPEALPPAGAPAPMALTCPACGAPAVPGEMCGACGGPGGTGFRPPEPAPQEGTLERYLELQRERERLEPARRPGPPPPPVIREIHLCPQCGMPLTRLDQVCSNCDLLSRNLLEIRPSESPPKPKAQGSKAEVKAGAKAGVKGKATTKAPAPTVEDDADESEEPADG